MLPKPNGLYDEKNEKMSSVPTLLVLEYYSPCGLSTKIP